MATVPAPRSTRLAVIDTNVLFDWLVFDDRRVAAVVQAIEAGTLRWIATPAMREEFDAVLERGFGPRWSPSSERAADAWERHAVIRAAPPAPTTHPRCRDPGDQMFVDAAIVERVDWILSRDRALLAMAKVLARVGLQVVTPDRWSDRNRT